MICAKRRASDRIGSIRPHKFEQASPDEESSSRIKRYLFAINTYANPTEAVLRVKGLKIGARIEVMFENRTLTATQEGIRDKFAGYEHHISRF